MSKSAKTSDQFSRLMAAAQAHADKHKAGEITQTAVANAMGASLQALTNWASRGLSAQAAITAEGAYGVSAYWLLHGVQPPAWPGAGDDDGAAFLLRAYHQADADGRRQLLRVVAAMTPPD
jgi:hypothetical protein